MKEKKEQNKDKIEQNKELVVFRNKKIRRTWHNNEWWFSVVDIVGALAESPNPNNYWKVLKHREHQLVTICNQLKLESTDGKYYSTDCVNTENAFRLIQSIPSKKAEPFKRWLAKVGYERAQEIQDPELAQQRMKELYRQKGYSDEWIEKRARGIAVRQELTDEWKNRGVEAKRDFAILTNEISKATFGKTVECYKQHKSLRINDNLRDHMGDMELILTMLGEAGTTSLTRERESKRFHELQNDAKDGGDVAGAARKGIEKKLGKSIISDENYLDTPEKVKRLKKKEKKELQS